MTYLSLFSGIGGFDLGLDRAGFRCVGQVECDKAALSVLAHRWPGVPKFEDVRKFNVRSIAVRPDLICGGFPCQDLSVAGRRAGLAGERSGLFFEFMRIVGEFAPTWVLVENVPGLLSSNNGRDMGAVIGGLADLGYGVAWRVLDAQWFGLAQQRRRVFIVGCAGADVRRAAEVLFERESLPWDPPPSRQAGARTARCLANGSGSSGQRYDGDTETFVAGPLDSRQGSGFPGTDGACSGHIVAALNASDGGADDNAAQAGHLVCGPLQAHSQRHGHAMTTQQAAESGHLVAHALTAEGHDASEDGTGGGTPIVPVHASGCGNSNNLGIGKAGDPMHTLDSTGSAAVAFQTRIARNGRGQPKEITDALTIADGGTHGDSKPHVAYAGGVRRLTPKECCRLQGFPDDWLDGLGLSDSAKYRLLGNAVAVPVAEWIGLRLIGVTT